LSSEDRLAVGCQIEKRLVAYYLPVESAFSLTIFTYAWYKTHAFMEPGYLLLHWQTVRDITASIHT
jgi:hypothetical protein